MNCNQFKIFKKMSCYEEFEIRVALSGISKLDVLKEIGHKIYNYYFFISEDGVFNWFDLDGNHIEDLCILKEIREKYIPKTITKCVIPNSVIGIGIDAFSYCKSLKEIIIPNSVTRIGDSAFTCCRSLTSITIPDSMTHIGYGAFADCASLKEIIIPNSVKHIDTFAFYFCESLEEIIIPDNITYIGHNTFSKCKSLNEVVFKGKTLEEVKLMKNYPFGIEDENVFKSS